MHRASACIWAGVQSMPWSLKGRATEFADALAEHAKAHPAAWFWFVLFLAALYVNHLKSSDLLSVCDSVSELDEMDVPSAVSLFPTQGEKRIAIRRILVSGTPMERFALWKITSWNDVQAICDPPLNEDRADELNSRP
jgi:hypothetical protein